MRLFTFPLTATGLILVAALVLGGPSLVGTLVVLGLLEISLSFDNAVINAVYLQRMSPLWQKVFLSVGILVAVFGMRFFFPLLIVALTGHVSLAHAFDLGIHHPDAYSHLLEQAHPAIATFGAVFLGMLFLDFITEEREQRWISPVEGALARLGKLDVASVVIMLAVLTIFVRDTLFAGVLGLITYLAVNAVAAIFEEREEADEQAITSGGIKQVAGMAAFGLFLYLEMIDASFSFDGVMAAFAITTSFLEIAVGNGIGALFIRTLTVFLVRKGVLQELVHLEHGAHYAIGALSVILFVTLFHEVPEIVSGGLSVAILGAALATSVIHNRRETASTIP